MDTFVAKFVAFFRQHASKLAFMVFLAIWLLAAITTPRTAPPRFASAVGEISTKTPEKPWFHRALLPAVAPSVHAASLAELPDGRIAAAWFAGAREGAGDVRIVFSVFNPQEAEWEFPKPIANREQTIRDTHRSVRKLGNPVIYTHGQRLHLFYVSAGLGGWAGSSINHRYSDDLGEHWSGANKLIVSPFLNISTLVRTSPIPMADGSLGLPVYHELGTKYGEWLKLTETADVISKVRMPHPKATLQPSVVPLDEKRAIAFLRDASPENGQIQVVQTEDAGEHWQAMEAAPMANPDASIAAIKLSDGSVLLAGNPGTGRETLELWLSDKTLKKWQKVKVFDGSEARISRENTSGNDNETSEPDSLPITCKKTDSAKRCQHYRELSYPALLQTQDGHIHLAYTWHRKRIQVLSFNQAWLTQNMTTVP